MRWEIGNKLKAIFYFTHNHKYQRDLENRQAYGINHAVEKLLFTNLWNVKKTNKSNFTYL